jgi:hypothetical protein
VIARIAILSLAVALCCATAHAAEGGADTRDTPELPVPVDEANQCPPDQSSVVLFTRQAVDEGSQAAHTAFREYAKFESELDAIAGSGASDDDTVERSMAAVTSLVQRMASLDVELTPADVIVHRETELRSLLRVDQPITKARYELGLSIIREMKRLVCER